MIQSPDTGEVYLLQGIIDLFELGREKAGVPIEIGAGYRTFNHQKELRRRGLRASKISPHEHGTAFDLSIRNIVGTSLCMKCTALIHFFSEAANELGLREYVRFGFKEYECGFVHVDIVPLLFDDEWKELAISNLDQYLDKFYPYSTINPCPLNWKKNADNW